MILWVQNNCMILSLMIYLYSKTTVQVIVNSNVYFSAAGAVMI